MHFVAKIRPFILMCSLVLMPSLGRTQTAKASRESGLLLGVRSDGATRKYYTLWIAIKDHSVHVEQIPGLLVPRDQGFSWIGHYFTANWYADEKTFDGLEQATFSEYLWLRPSDDQSKAPIAAGEERVASDEDSNTYCEYGKSVITYVGPKYVGLTSMESNPCGQNAAVIGSYDTFPIDFLNKSGRSLSSLELLGPEVEKAVERDRDAALDDNCPPLANEPGEPKWTLFHQEGSWRLKGWQETITACGGGTDYEIHVAPPESLAGGEPLGIPWKRVVSRVPTAADAVCSPRKDVLVVATPQDLRVFSLTAGNIEKVLGKFILPEGPLLVVMEQWALGRHVAAWNQEVQRQKEIRRNDQPF